MTAYLNVGTIRHAAELINATLKTKGHTSEDLKLVTIDWEELIQDQPEKEALEALTIQQSIYNNDKNVVNAIYSLLQDIERHNKQHEASNLALTQRDSKIARLEHMLSITEMESVNKEKKLTQLIHIDSPAQTKKLEDLTRTTKIQSREISRLRNLNADLQGKFEVEKRRMVHEISELKNSLVHFRGLSNAIIYGRSAGLVRKGDGELSILGVKPSVLYKNTPLVHNGVPHTLVPGSEEMQPVLIRDYEGIATQLSELLDRLMKENSKFTRFAQELTHYIEKVNSSIAPDKIRDDQGPNIVNPAISIDMKKVSAGAGDEVVPFEATSAPLLTSVYENHEAITTLVDMAVVSNWESKSSGKYMQNEQFTLLEKENRRLVNSLQESLAALDEWKKHKTKT